MLSWQTWRKRKGEKFKNINKNKKTNKQKNNIFRDKCHLYLQGSKILSLHNVSTYLKICAYTMQGENLNENGMIHS